MFQRNQFRSSTSQATSTNAQKQPTLRGETNQPNHLLASIHNYQQEQTDKHQQIIPTTKNFASYDRNDLSFKQSLLKPSWLRRVALTVATLRLTTASTTTAVPGGGESVATLFKSLLATCYYAIAFTSLLVLILYINRFEIQESFILSGNNINSKPPLLEYSNMIESKAELDGSGLIALNYIHYEDEIKIIPSNNNNLTTHLRTKRSPANNLRRGIVNNNHNSNGNHLYGPSSLMSDNHHGRLNGKTSVRTNNHLKIEQQLSSSSRLNNKTKPSLTTNELIKSDKHVDLIADKYVVPRSSSTSSELSTISNSLPELSERQADFSLNNRGASLTSSGVNSSINNNHNQLLPSTDHQPRETLTENSQWIPILASSQEFSRNQAFVTTRPQRRRSNSIELGSPNTEMRKPTQPMPSLPANLIEATSHRIEDNAAPGYNYHYSRHHHQHHQFGSYHNRQWRRPRFNGYHESNSLGQRPGKLYKRVLLCDKTLVSLDYVRNTIGLESPPPPLPNHYHLSNDDFDENVIDLDSNIEPVVALSNHRITAQNKSTASSSTSILAEPRLLSESIKNDIMVFERRSLLTDEDPLVKCDMWDLEKGLKNRKPPKEILQMAVKADFDTVRDAINRCRQLSEKNLPPDDEYRDGIEILSTEDLISLFSIKRGLIPGTKWCGLGDQASSYNDLGPKHRIDICCRAHDHCPIRLKPFRNDYGVLNIALYTKSHCDCDADFYRCLREAHSRTADMLGNLYFNVMKLQCMHQERMKICREMR